MTMPCRPRFAALAATVVVLPLGMRPTPSFAAPQDRFAEAVAATRKGSFAEAERLYRTLLKTQPGNAGAWANLGLVLGSQGRHRDAISCFDRAVRASPRTPDFAAQAALAALRAGDLRSSESRARAVLRTHPANALALTALTSALAAQRRFAEAVPPLRLLDSVRRGKDPNVVRSLVVCLAASGGQDAGLALLRTRARAFPKNGALASLQGDLAGQLGYDRKDKGLLIEAKSAYARAFAIDSSDARAGVNAALAAEMAGAPLEAKALYGQVLRHRPNDGPAHYGLGRVLLTDPVLSESARVAQARPHFEAAVAASPRNVDYLVALGFALGMAGPSETDNAANILRAALRIAPGDGRARRGLVEILVKANRPADAIEAQRALVAAEPDDKEARRRLAGLLRSTGSDAGAWEQLREIAKRDPNDVDALKELGILLEQAGKLDEAISTLESAVARAPKDADALTSLGLVLEKHGKRGDATQRYRAAISLDPKHQAANIALSAALEASGDAAGALLARETWMRADPTSNSARWETAQAHIRAGRDPEAIALLHGLALRRGDPQRNQYLLAVASLHEERGRWPEAVAEWRRLIALEPTEEMRFHLVDALGKAGRLAEAAREADALVTAAKDKVRARATLADLHEKAGRLDDAGRTFEDLLAQHADVAGIAEGLLRVRSAQGRRADAVSLLEATVLAGAGSTPVAVVRVLDRAANEDRAPDRFRSFTERLVSARPKERYSLALRAEVVLRGKPSNDDRREAAAMYGRMAELDPKDADAPFQQGRLLQAIGDRDGSVAALRESARRRPGGPAETMLKALGVPLPPRLGGKP
ncbi:MAG: tetratricopeptide repeat protein [Armatimonadota bacterium]